jgi:two-component system NtrC family sensor kinase
MKYVGFGRSESGRVLFVVAIVAVLLGLAIVNVSTRASWREAEDGVLWTQRPEGVVAREVAPDTAAAQAGIRQGDVLLAIDGRPIDSPTEVIDVHHARPAGARLSYAILRMGTRELRQISLALTPQPNRVLYFVMASVAMFTLLVGAAVRLRRPSDQASLHFFWLTVSFFGVLAFSPSGRFDRLDWFFYWADEVALLLLPPLFLHFALVFPDRPHAWIRTQTGRTLLPLMYLPALVLGGIRVAALGGRLPRIADLSNMILTLDRLELTYLAVGLAGGFAVMTRALRRVRSVTARRQLRWIVWGTALGAVPFLLGYVIPYAAGLGVLPRTELLAIPLGLVPLAFASAIVRYRLMDVEVIIKRTVTYSAALAAIAAMYALLLRMAEVMFFDGSDRHSSIVAMLATLVVVLLAQPVRTAIQNALDRAYYRDRYDYRRALVAFARDLNSDLDLHRLSERLMARIVETLLVDRMVLLLAPPGRAAGDFAPLCAARFPEDARPKRLARDSAVGRRVGSGHMVALDEAAVARRLPAEELADWRDAGIHYFVPCVSKDGVIAVIALGHKSSGEPLSSEDVALVAAVAGQVATALENARLYRELREKAGEIDRLREFSDNIIESLNEGLAVLDLDDRVVRWNTSFERLYGVDRDRAVGRTLGELFEPTFVAALRAAREETSTGVALYRVPLTSRHAGDPRRLLVNVGTVPLRTPDGSTAGTLLMLEDITGRVQLEEQLQITEKMASIGLLAAGVAHEVNTPLTGISSYTQMLLQGADPADPRTPLLEKIERQTFRAAKIVNSLLNLARPTNTDRGPVDLNVVINDVLSLLDHQLKAGRIKVRKQLVSPPPVVRAIEYKLQQVFLNLFLNARDAMPSGGWLSITTSYEDGAASVQISDTGLGIPAEHLSRIYDPFFTTKSIGQGTGLGLSITYGIVREHEGTITCHSTVGQGTRFALSLPLAGSIQQRTGEAAH